MILLDTDIMIDILRDYEPALKWLENLEEAPGLPGFVSMELMQGCRNNQEMTQLRTSLVNFRVYWPTDEDCNRALIDFEQGYLSHNLGILDALIGECAVGLNATLYTFNQKHFSLILNLITEQPYEKSESK